jgi:hypothetical protein
MEASKMKGAPVTETSVHNKNQFRRFCEWVSCTQRSYGILTSAILVSLDARGGGYVQFIFLQKEHDLHQ